MSVAPLLKEIAAFLDDPAVEPDLICLSQQVIERGRYPTRLYGSVIMVILEAIRERANDAAMTLIDFCETASRGDAKEVVEAALVSLA